MVYHKGNYGKYKDSREMYIHICLKLSFRSKIIQFIKNTYIIINASNDGICVEFEKKEHNLGLPTFKLPTSTKKGLKTHPLNIIIFDIFSICLLV